MNKMLLNYHPSENMETVTKVMEVLATELLRKEGFGEKVVANKYSRQERTRLRGRRCTMSLWSSLPQDFQM